MPSRHSNCQEQWVILLCLRTGSERTKSVPSQFLQAMPGREGHGETAALSNTLQTLERFELSGLFAPNAIASALTTPP